MEQAVPGRIIERLTEIWQQLFPHAQAKIDDKFIDLGGNRALASELFRRIEEVFGRVLSPILIYQAPTIASLAALLGAPDPLPLPVCVQLKAGNLEPSVFMTHGLGGNILEFFDLVKQLNSSRTFYGLQARGTDGLCQPCSTIKDMAGFHLESIRKVQPEGPYMLVGHSLGGLVMWEIAKLLSDAGEKVAFLMMIDSYPALRLVSLKERLGVYCRKLVYGKQNIQVHSATTLPLTPATREVKESARLAWEKYEPGYYHGTVIFIRAAISSDFPAHPDRFWGPRANQFELETVPGIHESLLTEHSESVARIISKHLSRGVNSLPSGE